MDEAQNKDTKEPVTGQSPAGDSPSEKVPMRQQLRNRFKADYPDDDYEADEDGEILGGRIMERLDRNDADLARYKEQDGKMKDLFVNNPATAKFFTRWGAGDDPVNLFAEVFGDKLKETVDSPDAENLMKTGLQKYFDNVKRNKDAEDEFTRNSEATLAMVQQREADGASPEEMQKVLDMITEIAVDMAVGKIAPETIDLMLNAINHDQHVKDAREEGTAMGRNERYQERLKQRGRGDGQPAAASGSAQKSNPDRQMYRQSDQQPRSAWEAPETRQSW